MDDAQCSDLYQREYLWQHEGTYVRTVTVSEGVTSLKQMMELWGW